MPSNSSGKNSRSRAWRWILRGGGPGPPHYAGHHAPRQIVERAAIGALGIDQSIETQVEHYAFIRLMQALYNHP